MIGCMLDFVPLIGQLSNRQFRANLDTMLTDGDTAIPVRARTQVCRCGCGQPVDVGPKFVNQAHYDRSKGLSSIDAERLLARFQQGASAKKLACEYGVAHNGVQADAKKQLS